MKYLLVLQIASDMDLISELRSGVENFGTQRKLISCYGVVLVFLICVACNYISEEGLEILFFSV